MIEKTHKFNDEQKNLCDFSKTTGRIGQRETDKVDLNILSDPND